MSGTSTLDAAMQSQLTNPHSITSSVAEPYFKHPHSQRDFKHLTALLQALQSLTSSTLTHSMTSYILTALLQASGNAYQVRIFSVLCIVVNVSGTGLHWVEQTKNVAFELYQQL
jgi:hypothetical protein